MSLIQLTLTPSKRDLGGFTVQRILPHAQRRMVGPFIFLDHMGPAGFASGVGIDVRPHPHIGLATVTYLFEGELLHRDTLGSVQEITPGAVNWMTAASGIAHSERTGSDERSHPHRAHGLQSWVALPKEYEEIVPEFFHHAADALPQFRLPGISLRLIVGEAYGHRAPVKIYSPIFYLETQMQAGSQLILPSEYLERAIYVVQGNVRVGDKDIQPKTLAVFTPKEKIVIDAKETSRVMLLGGDPFPEQRFIWWNFVSSSEERIEQAKHDWQAGRFGKIPGDDKEFIPLPK